MILITGATGTVGSALLDELEGHDGVRALVRREEAARALAERGVDAVVGSFEDPDALARAVTGADRLFLLSPPGAQDMVRAQVAVVDAARAAGVRHVVKLSSIGADEPTRARIIRAHAEIERHIEASGMAWTHLRPHWFMQNELGQADSILAGGTFYAPDVSRIALIDARDVAAVAARVLTGPGHENRAYLLTGPQALTYGDLAGVYSDLLGREVRWSEVTLEQARESMLEGGLPDLLATGFAEIMARYREGGVTARVSPDAERLLGRPPRAFEDFAREHLPVPAG
jgi:uncharacterized protein YbjT (DUF2867 family)